MPEPLSDKEIEEIRRLNEARTPGQWIAKPGGFSHLAGVMGLDGCLLLRMHSMERDNENAAFIAACSVAIPRLLDTVKALRQVLATIEEYDEDGRNPWEAIEEMRTIAIDALKEEKG